MKVSSAAIFLIALVSCLESLNGAAVQRTELGAQVHDIVKRETKSKITSMVTKIAKTVLVQLRGDGPERTGYCGAERSTRNERRQSMYTYRNQRFNLVAWGDVECSMDLGGSKGVGQPGDQLVHLLPPSSSWFSRFREAIEVSLLPIDTFDSASFTFLPDVTNDNEGRFFVTSVLSGCHFFLMRARNANCPILAVHANYCRDRDPRDHNEEHALAVIDFVNRANRNCDDYTIRMRFAPETDTTRHTYETNHYSMDSTQVSGNLLFGYTLGSTDSWHFCIKPLSNRQAWGLKCHTL